MYKFGSKSCYSSWSNYCDVDGITKTSLYDAEILEILPAFIINIEGWEYNGCETTEGNNTYETSLM